MFVRCQRSSPNRVVGLGHISRRGRHGEAYVRVKHAGRERASMSPPTATTTWKDKANDPLPRPGNSQKPRCSRHGQSICTRVSLTCDATSCAHMFRPCALISYDPFASARRFMEHHQHLQCVIWLPGDPSAICRDVVYMCRHSWTFRRH